MTNYAIPKAHIYVDYSVKKSQFITHVFPVNSRESALDALKQLKNEYPDARHHCWAYIIGDPNAPSLIAMSDDGEPSGTAGKLILNVMQHKGVGNIMVVVVRYFGGIKLGAGGLVRAYSSATQQAFERLETLEFIETANIEVTCDFDEEQKVRNVLGKYSGTVINSIYTTHVELTVSIALKELEPFNAALKPLRGVSIVDTKS